MYLLICLLLEEIFAGSSTTNDNWRYKHSLKEGRLCQSNQRKAISIALFSMQGRTAKGSRAGMRTVSQVGCWVVVTVIVFKKGIGL